MFEAELFIKFVLKLVGCRQLDNMQDKIRCLCKRHYFYKGMAFHVNLLLDSVCIFVQKYILR